MSFLNEFVLLLKARYPIIYIVTYEEERIEYIIRYCIKKYVSRTYYSWDFVDGYQGNPNDIGFATNAQDRNNFVEFNFGTAVLTLVMLQK